MIRLEPINIFSGNMPLNNLFNVIKLFDLICADEGKCPPGSTRPTRPANPMHIIFRDIG
jgi:hypothetical protein